MEEIKIEAIKEFINACNDFIDGKFILADIKISKILKVITKNEDLYNVVAECMINYNFEEEFEQAKIGQNNSKFILPKENHKIIPFIFCLLVEIDSKKLNFNEFLRTQFPFANNQNEEYDAFGKNIIIPFRDAIADAFGVDVYEKKENENLDEGKETMEEKEQISLITNQVVEPIVETVIEEKNKEDAETKLLFDRISRLAGILDDKLFLVRNPLRKSNIGLLIDALYEACSTQSVKVIVALVMALNTFAGGEKNMRAEIKELNNICYNFYQWNIFFVSLGKSLVNILDKIITAMHIKFICMAIFLFW